MRQPSTIAIAAALTTALAMPAVAGSLKPPVMEPEVAAPAPAPVAPPPASYDWTGAYVGGNLGYDHAGTSPNIGSGSSGLGGVYAGYNYDMGNFVLGGELGADKMHAGTGGGSHLSSTVTAKLRAGYDMGRTLLYAAVGAQHANGNINGAKIRGTGALVGIGFDHALTNNWSVGAEADYTRYKNADGVGTKLNNSTVVARVSYRF